MWERLIFICSIYFIKIFWVNSSPPCGHLVRYLYLIVNHPIGFCIVLFYTTQWCFSPSSPVPHFVLDISSYESFFMLINHGSSYNNTIFFCTFSHSSHFLQLLSGFLYCGLFHYSRCCSKKFGFIPSLAAFILPFLILNSYFSSLLFYFLLISTISFVQYINLLAYTFKRYPDSSFTPRPSYLFF